MSSGRASRPNRGSVACIIPAKDEQDRIVATVQAARLIPGVDVVFVCDDGSTDLTGSYAHGAGAVVVTHQRSRGHAAAIESAVNALGVLEQRDNLPEAGMLLLLAADAEESASNCRGLVESVAAGDAALAIAVPPSAEAGATEDGLLTTLAARGIAELAGWTPRAPLSVTRCLTRRAFELASPLAAGRGAEVGMTVDVLRAGLRVVELEVDLRRHPPATDIGAQFDRARQLADVTRALTARGVVGNRLTEMKESGGVSGLLKRIGR